MATLQNKVRSNPLGSVDAASFQFNITSAEIFSFDHGFAARPRHADLFIVCLVAELGYAVGDKIKIQASASVTMSVNKTACRIAAVTLPSVVNASNVATAITAANWNWFITLED